MENRNTIIKITIVVILFFIMAFSILYLFKDKKNDKKENTTTTTKICDEGYELINNNCIKEIERLNANIEYNCDEDYQFNGKQCTKYEENYFADVIEECPTGFAQGGDPDHPDLCYREVTEKTDVTYYCSEYGYTLKGNKCVNKEGYNPQKEIICPYSSTYIESENLCFYMGIFKTCPSGSTINAGNARTGYTCKAKPEIRYRCPEGTTKDGNNCYTTDEKDADQLHKCPHNNPIRFSEGGEYCTYPDWEIYKIVIKCKEKGFTWNGNACTGTGYAEPTISYSCDYGYVLDGTECVKYSIK